MSLSVAILRENCLICCVAKSSVPLISSRPETGGASVAMRSVQWAVESARVPRTQHALLDFSRCDRVGPGQRNQIFQQTCRTLVCACKLFGLAFHCVHRGRAKLHRRTRAKNMV